MEGAATERVALRDFEPEREEFLREALQGLLQPRKELPCKYFYDERGSRLFERICRLEEYYPTRTELGIMERHAGEMARALGARVLLIEYGSGSSAKTRLLLDQLEAPVGYVPVDISREHLVQSAAALSRQYPELAVLPVCADFTRDFEVPSPQREPARRAVYFPGSTIGNFEGEPARALLRRIHAKCRRGGALLIGVDLRKDRETLERAYDDDEGVTAAFNLNVLARLNRELGADFDLECFAHRAVWVETEGRVEMHLVSKVAQSVRLDGHTIRFAAGESICTEHCHKYSVQEFAALAGEVGFAAANVWTDPERRFSVQYFEAR